jgi:hypothetical protein
MDCKQCANCKRETEFDDEGYPAYEYSCWVIDENPENEPARSCWDGETDECPYYEE